MPPSRGEDYPYARRTIRGQRTRIDIPYMSSQGVRPCSSTLALQNGDGHPNNAGIRAGRRGFRCRLHAICRVPAYIRPETYSRMPLVGTDSGDTPPWKCPHFIRGVRLRCLHGAIFRSRAEFLGIDNLRASGKQGVRHWVNIRSSADGVPPRLAG